MKYTNIAFYYFFKVPGFLETSRKKLKRLCHSLGLKGSIILAPEGINLMVAGLPDSIREFKAFLEEWIGTQGLFFKESYSTHIPFNRMLIKVKSQTIPVNDSDVDPTRFTAPHLAPAELKQWLDEKKDILLFDTRNRFEYQVGTFELAEQVGVDHFRDFEKKLSEMPAEWKEKPVVAFCTGGIRCEKATPLMIKHGFKNVYQLDGGILNYFEKVGGSHYQGDCFVFDKRVALNPKLEETNHVECFNCRHPVTPEEQKLPSYQYEVSCPYCYDDRTEV